MSVALSNDGKDALERTINIESHDHDDDDVRTFFEVDRCIKWIREKDLKNVTLQFPDTLLPKSVEVAITIEKEIKQRVSILGDTTFGDCCVDEVAAEHIGADGIIHFGKACLAPTRRLPVLHIFTTLPLDINYLKQEISLKFASQKLSIFYDVQYNKNLSTFEMENVLICPPSSEENELVKCGRTVKQELDSSWSILYVGHNENLAFLLNLEFPKSTHWMYDPKIPSSSIEKSSVNVKRALMKRYYIIERAKDSNRIGILVGTLAVSRYRNIIDYVKEVIKSSGKKSYTFLVGKPNVPKLANFAEIDLFVMIGCPETSVIDSKDFLVPIATPFELDVAINKNRNWDGTFVTFFQDILPEGRKFIPFEPKTDIDLSLISGKVRNTSLDDCPIENSALLAQETTMSVLHKQGGGEFLTSRSWQGLTQQLGETPITDAVEGLSGIASGYSGEGSG